MPTAVGMMDAGQVPKQVQQTLILHRSGKSIAKIIFVSAFGR